MELVRLNKHLKDLGLCSRRKADEFIAKGYVKVNGNIITELGFKVNPATDKLEVMPAFQEETAKFRYILLNKPKGYICSKSEMDGKNIFELVPPIQDLTYAGRLDKDSYGLMILSNDGQFVYNVSGSEFAKEKEYIVRVNKPLTKEYLKQQGSGDIRIDGKRVKPCVVQQISEAVYKIILTEGINRQIRRMAENQGYRVINLKRVRIDKIIAPHLAVGQWRDLTAEEIRLIKNT